MSRFRVASIALSMAFAVPALTSAAVSASSLSGTWQSRAQELPLNAPHQEAVWGDNAREIRTVRLVVRQAGEATLTVNRHVVDARGRVVKATTSIEHADLQIGDAETAAGVRTDLPATVKLAERRYPDDPAGTWTIQDLRVTVTAFTDDPAKLEVRLDFPDGRGSFWEELRRTSAGQR